MFNRQDTNIKLGRIENLIIDAHAGRIMYGILDTGVGGKKIPIPWVALRIEKTGSDNYYLVLNVTKDQLANAPIFDRERWADFTNSEWQQRVDKFFGVRTAARPTVRHESKRDDAAA